MKQYLLLASILVIGVAGYSQVKADSFFVDVRHLIITDTINGRTTIVAERDSAGVWKITNASRALEVAYQTSLTVNEHQQSRLDRVTQLCNAALKVIYRLSEKGMVVRGYKKDIKRYDEAVREYQIAFKKYLEWWDRPLIVGENPIK